MKTVRPHSTRGKLPPSMVYVLRNPARETIKLGITSRKLRFREHRQDGYTERLFLVERLPVGVPERIEKDVLTNLRACETYPIRGVEYFTDEAASVVLRLLAAHHLLTP